MNKETIDKYKKLGWEFSSDEHFFYEREWSLKYRSPRMESTVVLSYFKVKNSVEDMLATIEEETLLKDERRVYSGQFYRNNQYYIEGIIRDAVSDGKESVTIQLK